MVNLILTSSMSTVPTVPGGERGKQDNALQDASDQSLYRNLSRGKEKYLRKKYSQVADSSWKTQTGQIMKEAFYWGKMGQHKALKKS